MKKRSPILALSVIAALLCWFCAFMGLFDRDGGISRTVESIYGETVELFGDGVYANNSMLKAATAKGTDIVMLLAALLLLVAAFKRNSGEKIKLLHCGFLVSILYYSANLAFGIAYNRMFLAYVFLFSASLFAFIFSLADLSETVRPARPGVKYTGTAIFTIIAGCTALVWFMSILPTVLTNEPLDIIGVSTTEPTFVIDIGLILPACVAGGVLLIKNRPMGYILPPVMLTFLTVMAVTVIGQTAAQMRYGVIISIQQVIGYAAVFVLFGFLALIINIRFMLKCWPDNLGEII